MRSLTGIRPTGQLHLGHYFSVIRPALEEGATVLVAEYHAPQCSTEDVDAVFRTLLRFRVFDINRQSNVFHPESYFRLLSISRIGELERMTQFMSTDTKDAHLLVYPVLMAHDIMGYDTVYVGEDQTQHINYARDLIERYNRMFKLSYPLPEAKAVGGRVRSLTSPERKMSKSEPRGCLFLDDTAEQIRAKIKAAVTTAQGRANLVHLYRLLGGEGEIPEMNSEFKPMLADLVLKLCMEGADG